MKITIEDRKNKTSCPISEKNVIKIIVERFGCQTIAKTAKAMHFRHKLFENKGGQLIGDIYIKIED